MPAQYTYSKKNTANNDGYDSGYESDGQTVYRPKKKIGQGNYSRARLFESRNRDRVKVVLDPVTSEGFKELEIRAKTNFYQILYPDQGVQLFKDKKTYRLVVPLVPGKPYEQTHFKDKIQQIKLFRSAIEAVKKAHQLQLIIIDLKEDNIYFDENSGVSYLIDGGLSALEGESINYDIFCKDSVYDVMMARKKYKYLPPECWSTKEVPACKSMDVYVLGTMMNRILTVFDSELVAIIKSCIKDNPNERPGLDELDKRLENLLPKELQKTFSVKEQPMIKPLDKGVVGTPEIGNPLIIDLKQNDSIERKNGHLESSDPSSIQNPIPIVPQYTLQQKERFIHQLNHIKKKGEQLQNKGHMKAAQAANQLYDSISQSAIEFFDQKISQFEFSVLCTKAIEDARLELEKFREWPLIFVNIGLAIAGLGVGFIIAGLINKAVTGHFLFFRPDSAIQLDELENCLNAMRSSTLTA